jgi:hypothetical protein
LVWKYRRQARHSKTIEIPLNKKKVNNLPQGRANTRLVWKFELAGTEDKPTKKHEQT